MASIAQDGHLWRLEDSGSTAWTYVIMGRVISDTKTITGTTAFTAQYTCDALSRERARTSPDGEVAAPANTPQALIASLPRAFP